MYMHTYLKVLFDLTWLIYFIIFYLNWHNINNKFTECYRSWLQSYIRRLVLFLVIVFSHQLIKVCLHILRVNSLIKCNNVLVVGGVMLALVRKYVLHVVNYKQLFNLSMFSLWKSLSIIIFRYDFNGTAELYIYTSIHEFLIHKTKTVLIINLIA